MSVILLIIFICVSYLIVRIGAVALEQSGLRERDLMVLSIERNEGVIPVPKAQNKIQVGDRLICYGKLENLKGIVLNKLTLRSNEQQGEQKGGGND